MSTTPTTEYVKATTPEYAKVTKHTTWQELVPFLRTDDIVAVRFREGEPEHIAKVWVSRDTTRVMAGARFLQYAGGRFNARVADVVLHSVCEQTNDLEPLAASLKAGDVVRATFVYEGSSAATLEGTVLTDEDGDALLVVEDEDGGSSEVYYLTFFGRIADTLRALEVIDPDEDDEDTAIAAHNEGADRVNGDDVIEKAARAMAAYSFATPDAWDVWATDQNVRDNYRQHARAALKAAGVDLPPEGAY